MTLHSQHHHMSALLLAAATLFGTCLPSTTNADRLPGGYPPTQRSRVLINTDWQFQLGDEIPGATDPGFDASSWERVNIPHPLTFVSNELNGTEDDETQPTFHRHVGWYRRNLKVNARPEDRVFLEFEGVHNVTDVWVNGQHIGQHDVGGYTPFHFDISQHVHRDGQNNLVVVKADNRPNPQVPPDGHRYDYVLFGGFYRDAYLVVKPPLHVTFPWEAREAGIFLTTPSVSKENATISARTTVLNSSPAASSCRLTTRVIDADNRVVLKLTESATLAAGATYTFLQTGGIDEKVHLWSADDPYLYRVNTKVEQLNDNGETLSVDCVENPLGLRWFELRPGIGFCWNGEPTELVGTNRHQQYPYIGDALPDSLHEQDAHDFKAAGFNIVRLAHYPHDDAFIRACDRLGILTCEEPPSWIEFGPPSWMDRLEQALRRTIRNHRNHPSLWAWGAGINHRGPVKRLHYAAKQEDPTRLTMNNGTLWTGPQNAGICDLYAVMDYRGATCPPGKFLIAMEHGNSASARANQRIVSQYRAAPERIGLTAWNSHDHPTLIRKPNRKGRLAICGIWDQYRRPKPVFDWYRSELINEPVVHIPDDRAQQEGKLVIFSNCEQVELLLDGKSLGRRLSETPEPLAHLIAPPFEFPLDWTEGTLIARGYIDGKLCAEHTRSFPGQPHHLELAFEQTSLPADGFSIALATARICDAQGTLVPTATDSIRFRLEGPGQIVGDESIGANPLAAERGLATVLVKTGTQPGQLRLIAESQGLKTSAPAQLTTTATTNDLIVRNARPIRDLQRYRVDLGGEGQHVEDEWIAWTSDAPQQATLTLSDKGPTARLSSKKGTLQWATNWGVPGELSFMIEDAITTDPDDEIELQLNNLSAGKYRLVSWHHILSSEQKELAQLNVTVDDANGSGRVALSDYSPTHGSTTLITVDGGGSLGDIGHRQAAQAGATLKIRSDGKSAITIHFRNVKPQGQLRLCGFDLQEL